MTKSTTTTTTTNNSTNKAIASRYFSLFLALQGQLRVLEKATETFSDGVWITDDLISELENNGFMTDLAPQVRELQNNWRFWYVWWRPEAVTNLLDILRSLQKEIQQEMKEVKMTLDQFAPLKDHSAIPTWKKDYNIFHKYYDPDLSGTKYTRICDKNGLPKTVFRHGCRILKRSNFLPPTNKRSAPRVRFDDTVRVQTISNCKDWSAEERRGQIFSTVHVTSDGEMVEIDLSHAIKINYAEVDYEDRMEIRWKGKYYRTVVPHIAAAAMKFVTSSLKKKFAREVLPHIATAAAAISSCSANCVAEEPTVTQSEVTDDDIIADMPDVEDDAIIVSAIIVSNGAEDDDASGASIISDTSDKEEQVNDVQNSSGLGTVWTKGCRRSARFREPQPSSDEMKELRRSTGRRQSPRSREPLLGSVEVMGLRRSARLLASSFV